MQQKHCKSYKNIFYVLKIFHKIVRGKASITTTHIDRNVGIIAPEFLTTTNNMLKGITGRASDIQEQMGKESRNVQTTVMSKRQVKIKDALVIMASVFD